MRVCVCVFLWGVGTACPPVVAIVAGCWRSIAAACSCLACLVTTDNFCGLRNSARAVIIIKKESANG